MTAQVSNPRFESFKRQGGADTVLLVHGFLDNPGSFRWFADQVVDATGWSVQAVRLPGHGTTPEDLQEVEALEWIRAVRSAYEELEESPGRTVLLGFSLGGLLCYRIAGTSPPDGLVLLSPALTLADRWYYGMSLEWWIRLVGRVVPYVPRFPRQPLHDPTMSQQINLYDWIPMAAARQLVNFRNETLKQVSPERIRCPVLGLSSRPDPVVDSQNVQQILSECPNPRSRLREFAQGGHVVHLDLRRQAVLDEVTEFLTTRV